MRQVQIQPKKTTAETKARGNDVASILARRVAMEVSDSEGSSGEEDAEEDDEWS